MKKILKVNWISILSIIAVITVFIVFVYFPFDEKLLLGFIGAIVTFYFGINKTQIENDKFFKELFRDFNLRYTKLNEPLYIITSSKKSAGELTFSERDTIYDYFNLCAEEYYWYKKNRINETVWRSWKNGMEFWISKPIIKDLWDEEMENTNSKASYYMNSNEDFFKN